MQSWRTGERWATLAGAILLSIALPIAIDQGYFRYNAYALPILGLVVFSLYLRFVITTAKIKAWGRSVGALSTVLVFAAVGALVGFVWYRGLAASKDHVDRDKQAENLPAALHSPTNVAPDPALMIRISQLLNEASEIQGTCQSVPDSYHTPPEARADLVNSILVWQQRVQAVLSLDTDPQVGKLWQKAILYSNPNTPPSVALYCTVLAVKIRALQDIVSRKTTTPRQVQAKLQTLIDEGESLKSFCLLSGDEKAMQEQETNWTLKVSDWLGIYFDDSYQQDFNQSGSSAMKPDQLPKTALGLKVWQRNTGRVDCLRRFLNEIRTEVSGSSLPAEK